MSAGALLGKDTDTSSVLRFGLTGLKPIKVSEVIKLGGVKLRRIYRNFAPSDTIRTYDDYANIKYTTIFNSIKIPDQFDVETLSKYYANKSITSFKSDKEYQKQLENVKQSRGTIGPFIDFIKYMKKEYQDTIYDLYMTNANNFFASDLSFSVFNDMSRGDHLFATFLNLLHHTLNSYQRKFSMRARHDEKIYNRLFNEMKGELDNIINYYDNMSFYGTCLRRLMIIWNAEDYDHLNDIKEIKYKKIPEDDFLRIHIKYKTSIRTSRNSILTHKYYREEDSIDVKPPTLEYLSQDLLRPLFFSEELRLPEWEPQ